MRHFTHLLTVLCPVSRILFQIVASHLFTCVEPFGNLRATEAAAVAFKAATTLILHVITGFNQLQAPGLLSQVKANTNGDR